MNRNYHLSGITAIAIASVFTACSSKPQVKNDGTLNAAAWNENLTVCDISKISDTLAVPLSEWVEDLQIVRFENKDTALFKMWWPAITEKHIGIRQRDDGVFKLFDRQGKFLCDVGGVGQGPGEYISLYGEAIDDTNQCIYLAPFYGSTKILKYNMDGTYATGIEVGEKMNKPKLMLNEDGSLTLVHLFFKESSKMLAAHISKDGTVTPYLPSPGEGSNLTNNQGHNVGFNDEIWCYDNAGEPSFMFTYADSLYHYDLKNNRMETRFTTINGPKECFKIYNELPGKYVVFVSGLGSFVADTQTKSSYFLKLKNDFVGGLKVPTNFTNGYFFALYEPLQLADRIESRLAESDCTEQDKKVLNELLSSLHENDNSIMFIGKLK